MRRFYDIRDPLLVSMRAGDEICAANPAADAAFHAPFSAADVTDAERRFRRFAPLIGRLFPETAANGGLIESPLTEIPAMRAALRARGHTVPGRLFLKRDGDLPVAGSVKARGGVYEVLKHTETLALQNGLLTGEADDHGKLASPAAKAFFGGYGVQVGSTGNLGLSIGVMSAALGYRATVHMSADAKEWKKALLRERGVTVKEYAGDYAKAVEQGRLDAARDEKSYFVDDENSADLFLGYATAAGRLKAQLDAAGITVDEAHPLYVYLPCGVGGAPGGVTFGIKLLFGAAARCFTVEPTMAPCLALGLLTGQHNGICVQDIGLSGRTQADGLAVGRCSGLVCKAAGPLIDGFVTVKDERLPVYQKLLWQTEGLFVEPSAAAAFHGLQTGAGAPGAATHVVWSTGGSLVPADVRSEMLADAARPRQ